MYNSVKNILSVKRFPFFIWKSDIAKKWLTAKIFGIFICFPCFSECASFKEPHLPTETTHSDSLVGIAHSENLVSDLTAGKVGILMNGGLNTFKDVSEGMGSFVEFSSHIPIFAEQMICKAAKQSTEGTEKKRDYNFWWHFVIPALLGSFSTVGGFVVYHFTVGRD